MQKYASKKCRRLFRGEIPYTPDLRKLIAKVRVWKLVVRKKQGRKVGSRLLRRTLKKAKIDTPFREIMRVTSDQAKEILNICYKEYAEFKRQAGQQRKNWLIELANERASLEDKSRKNRFQCRQDGQQPATAKHIKMILQLEGIRTMYRRIDHAVEKQRMKGVTMVLEKNSMGEWVERNTPQEIFQALTKEYHAKYHQTEQTPPMRNPMVHMLGYLGTNT